MPLPAIFAIVIGVGMTGQWTFSYLTHQIPELRREPIRIGFHIAESWRPSWRSSLAG